MYSAPRPRCFISSCSRARRSRMRRSLSQVSSILMGMPNLLVNRSFGSGRAAGDVLNLDLHLLRHLANGLVVALPDQVCQPLVLLAPVTQLVAVPGRPQLGLRETGLTLPDLQGPLHVLLLGQGYRRIGAAHGGVDEHAIVVAQTALVHAPTGRAGGTERWIESRMPALHDDDVAFGPHAPGQRPHQQLEVTGVDVVIDRDDVLHAG